MQGSKYVNKSIILLFQLKIGLHSLNYFWAITFCGVFLNNDSYVQQLIERNVPCEHFNRNVIWFMCDAWEIGYCWMNITRSSSLQFKMRISTVEWIWFSWPSNSFSFNSAQRLLHIMARDILVIQNSINI